MELDKTQPIPPELTGVMEWFNETVGRLESAYRDLGEQFARVNRELADTNRRLEHHQRRLHALLESMGTGVIMVDPMSCLTVINRFAEQLLGVRERDCLGKPIGEVFSPQSGVGEVMGRALRENRRHIHEEMIFRIGDREIPVAVVGSIVIDADGEVLGAMETMADLTELRRMQAEIQQDRILRALGEMAATVAHEIRNPLGGIGGYAGLLARGIPPEDPRRRLVDKIIQGVSSLNKIVSNLLVYTRKMTLQKVRVDLGDWMESVLAHAEIEIEKEGRKIRLERNFPDQPVYVSIDPERFQQVALNLLFNAIQAIDGEGWIRVSIAQGDSHRVCLSVQDSGRGIAPEHLERIFTPFFTTKEQGTGLGLAIVKKLVDLHDGEIRVESVPGNGARFMVILKG